MPTLRPHTTRSLPRPPHPDPRRPPLPQPPRLSPSAPAPRRPSPTGCAISCALGRRQYHRIGCAIGCALGRREFNRLQSVAPKAATSAAENKPTPMGCDKGCALGDWENTVSFHRVTGCTLRRLERIHRPRSVAP
eukprot:9488110-Pyramimonas_sp.AAC.1